MTQNLHLWIDHGTLSIPWSFWFLIPIINFNSSDVLRFRSISGLISILLNFRFQSSSSQSNFRLATSQNQHPISSQNQEVDHSFQYKFLFVNSHFPSKVSIETWIRPSSMISFSESQSNIWFWLLVWLFNWIYSWILFSFQLF